MYFELARRWGEAPIAPATEDASAQAKSPVDTVLAYALRAAEAALVLPKYDQLTDASGAAGHQQAICQHRFRPHVTCQYLRVDGRLARGQ